MAKTTDGRKEKQMNKATEQFIDNHNRQVAAKIYEDGMTIADLKTWIEQESGMVAKRRAVKILDAAGVADTVNMGDLRAEVEPKVAAE